MEQLGEWSILRQDNGGASVIICKCLHLRLFVASRRQQIELPRACGGGVSRAGADRLIVGSQHQQEKFFNSSRSVSVISKSAPETVEIAFHFGVGLSTKLWTLHPAHVVSGMVRREEALGQPFFSHPHQQPCTHCEPKNVQMRIDDDDEEREQEGSSRVPGEGRQIREGESGCVAVSGFSFRCRVRLLALAPLALADSRHSASKLKSGHFRPGRPCF